MTHNIYCVYIFEIPKNKINYVVTYLESGHYVVIMWSLCGH